MRSLAWKLVCAFLIVGVAGAALAFVLARWFTLKEFDRLVLDQAQSDFVDQVSVHYQIHGSWDGVARSLPPRAPVPQPPQPGDRASPVQQPPPFSFALVDQNGYVVVPAARHRIGDHVPAADLARGVAVEVDGQVVGTVLTTGSPPELTPREELFLERTNQALLYAALGATAMALFLGIFLARTLTRPLRELTRAIRAMTQGELEQRIPVRSQDELGQLAAAFNLMSADLARANQLRRQMTADIAHDLRSPLAVITGYVESLRDGVLDPSPERFDVMYSEAQHLQRLVEDLRTLSLADAGELTLNCQPTSPGALLERAAAAYSRRAQRRDIALQVQAGALPEINVDPERMAQVLGNLLSNALRHTPEGGQIVLSARQQVNGLQLAVQDSGEGIAPEDLPHVFDRFYRGDASRQQQEGESGLGLAIAKSIIEAHGGTIAVQSELGRGTTFVMLLPF
jgi:signal transduction histidine kinase